MRTTPSLALILIALLAACGDAPQSVNTMGTSRAAAPHARAQAPAGEPHFHVQPGWVEEAPASNMRHSQYRLPGSNGQADASLVVYYFGPGGGGDVDSNLRRWAGQFTQTDGGDSYERMTRSERTLGALRISECALTGIYDGDMLPDGSTTGEQRGWSLRGAVIECAGGPYFIKLTGPQATVEHWQASYAKFLEGTDPASHAAE